MFRASKIIRPIICRPFLTVNKPTTDFLRKKTDGLNLTWYQVLGIKENATGMDVEEAFHLKLTSTDDLAQKTSDDEIDAILEQSVSIQIHILFSFKITVVCHIQYVGLKT